MAVWPLLASGGLSLLSGLVNSLKGPSAQEKLYKYLQGEASKPLSELGYTGEEKNAMRFGAENRLKSMSADRFAAESASVARRGGTFSKQAGMDIEGGYAREFGKIIPQIDIDSMRVARERKDRLMQMLTGLAPSMPDNNLDLSGLAEQLSLWGLLKQNQNNNSGDSGFSSSNFMTGLG